MLVLALDTATAGVVVGLARVGSDVAVLVERRGGGPPRHGEAVSPGIHAVLTEAGHSAEELAAVVVGVGPGPFTGLRVGMVSAAALADALAIPVYGVGSLDATVLGLPDPSGRVVVAADARRREVYWAVYDEGLRVDGPHVSAPATVGDVLAGHSGARLVGAGAVLHGLPGAQAAGPTGAGLVAAAGTELTAGRPAGPLVAAYLRRPDATELAARIPAASA